MRQAKPIGLTALLALTAFAGCTEPQPSPDTLDLLTPRGQLVRLSMDLRGVHPTEAELVAYEASEFPELDYAAHADAWIDTADFLPRIREIFNERFLIRTGDVYFDYGDIPALSGVDDRRMADNIANEVLSLLEYVVLNDLPYSYLVTAPHTMANPELAAYWGIDYPEDGGGNWAPALYEDGRPHAGVLTMSTTWQRYPSMGGNANRHRANAISKIFLCDDYLTRPIVLNRAAVDQLTVDPENAISQNTGCQGCHASLDPMAANFFGFFNYDAENGLDSARYRPENEEEWRYFSGREPAYYGRPTGNIPEFGAALAGDSRFSDCAVRTVWEGLTQREMVDEDWAEVAQHAEVFVAADQNVKELVRSIVNSPTYKARSARDPELADRLAGIKLVSPEQLSSVFRQLTGYTWFFDGRDGLRNNSLGLPVLAGGIDSRFVTRRGYTPTVGLVFVQERLAQASAYYVAQHDLDPERTGQAKLLLYVTVHDTPESAPDAFEEQIRHLYLAITGHPLADEATEPQQLTALWKQLYSVEASATSAWAGVLSVVLRDPSVILY